MSPVLEEQAATVSDAVERGAVVRPEATPDRQVVSALEHVDRVHLQPANVFHEAAETPGAERRDTRASEMLALEEERGDPGPRDDDGRHAPRD